MGIWHAYIHILHVRKKLVANAMVNPCESKAILLLL